MQSLPKSTPYVTDRPTATIRRRATAKWITIVSFLAPALILYVLLVLVPIAQAVYFSLYRWNGLGPLSDFRGVSNYVRLFSDDVFLSTVWHNLVFVALSICIQLPLALGLALIIGRDLPGRTFFRLLFFMPFVLAEVIAAVIWSHMLRPDVGLVNFILRGIGLDFLALTWLGDTSTVLLSVFVVITWKYFGFHMIMYVAALQNIPQEIEEAARIDGATSGQVIRHITIPMIASTIRMSIFFSVVGALQVFDLVWILTSGGPAHASETMAVFLIKQGFQRLSVGYGSAVAVVMFLMCLVFSLAYQRIVMRRDLEGGVTSIGG